jgi:hypothetical protein
MRPQKVSLRSFFSTRNLMILIIFTLVYVALTFGTSFLGFLAPEPPVALRQYTPISLLEELGGHFLFGAIAALPFFDLDLIFLTGIFAVAIDTDHILYAMGFYVSETPDHSFFYAILSGLILLYVARRMKLGKEREIKFAFLGPVVVLSHISYDIFASYAFFIERGYSFPLFDPFSFSKIPFSFNYWLLFEISAFLLAVCGLYVARKVQKRTKETRDINKKTKAPR